MEKLYSISDLAKKLNCNYSTISIYICRSEFAHWRKKIINHHHFFSGATKEDIELLKTLVENRKNRKNRNKKNAN